MTIGQRLTVGTDDVAAYARDLTAEWNAERAVYVRQILGARRGATDAGTAALTRSRLTAVADAFEHNANVIGSLLAPLLALADGAAELSETSAHKRGFLAYLFRDWVWGQSEIDELLTGVSTSLPDFTAEHLLAVGGGAMRLPRDLARRLGATKVTVVERDPVLCCAVDRLQAGDALELFEIPVTPRNLASVAALRTLEWTDEAPPLDIVLADARSWEPREPVDVLLTPFVLDVAGADAIELIERWTSWLRPEGWWIDVGPLGFRSPATPACYTIEEVRDRLPSLGLDVRGQNSFDMNHLASPLSGRVQRYTIEVTVAQKCPA